MTKHPDRIRIMAIGVLVFGLLYFYAYIFMPWMVPELIKVGVPGRPYNILLLGTDFVYNRDTNARASENGNSDVIMLININPISDHLTVMSIPRDTIVDIPEYGTRKLNSAYPLGGPELTIKTLKNNFGIRVDHFIVVHPNMLVDTIDDLGGVVTYVDRDMEYVDKAGGVNIDFKEGWHKMSGKEALGFIRFRMEARGDVARVERQQRFISDIIKTIVKPSTLPRLPFIAGIMLSNIRTNIPLTQSIQIINFVRLVKKSHQTFLTFPGEFVDHSAIGSTWKPNLELALPIIREYFN